MNLPMRLAQSLVNAAWRATHRPRAVESKQLTPTLQPVSPGTGGWFGIVRESFAGAWQRNIEVRTDQVLTQSTFFACTSLITSDVSKLRMRLVERSADGIWTETVNPAFSPVLRKPNRYQSRIQFFANWIESKIIHGNTYVLKERDARNVVVRLHILNPELVTVLVAPDGAVYYELRADFLAGVLPGNKDTVIVPSNEIIHDRWNTMTHPLVGTSPIRACGLAALQGLKIQTNSVKFFSNGSLPSGLILVPGNISQEKTREIKTAFQALFSPDGSDPGGTAVLGSGMTYQPLSITATDAQLIEQLKITSETICSVLHVPPHMVGIGAAPTYNNIEALNQQYYSQCLQVLIESIEELLDSGLGLGPGFGNAYGTEFALDDLLRMDTKTKIESVKTAVGGGVMAPNEGRAKLDLAPVPGGDTPFLQEQYWPIRHLSERELPARPPTPPEEIEPDGDDGGDTEPAAEDETAEERQRNVISFETAIERAARDYERRSA